MRASHAIFTGRALRACVLLTSLICCTAPEEQEAGLVEQRAMRGDTLVVTHIAGQRWTTDRTLDEVVRIGGSDDVPEEYLFGRINSIAARGAGPVYVYDDQFHQLRMYDSAGTFVRLVGRRGRGPGEFQYVIALSVMWNGQLTAWDARSNRINLFSAAGDRVDEFQLQLGGGLFTAKVFATDTADTYYVLTLTRGRLRMLHVDRGGRIVDTIMFPKGQPFQGMDHVHARLESTLHHHGYYVWGTSDRYLIHARTEAGAPMQIERRVSTVPFTSDERAHYQLALDSSTRREREDERPRGEFGTVPVERPFFSDIVVARDGTIWVRRALANALDRGEVSRTVREEFDVFASDGALLGHVHIPYRASVATIDGEHVWGTVRDEDGVVAIVRWKLAAKH